MSGQWALVLGSSVGTGAAICEAVAEEPGLHVFGVHRGNHPEGAAEVRQRVEARSRRYEELVAEAGKEEILKADLAAVRAVVPPRSLKLFVHSLANASVGHLAHGGTLLHRKQVEKTFNSMAHSFVYWTRGLLEADLLAPEARVLALTNAITDSNLVHLGAIAAAKAALEMYVRHLAWELGPLGHRVNALKFSTAETEALKWIFPADVWDRVREVHHEMMPAGRMIRLDEVARLVSVLAGDRGAWFNGAVIDFSGGQMNAVYQVLMDEVIRTARRG